MVIENIGVRSKRGWIRILEATIAVLIVSAAMLAVYSEQSLYQESFATFEEEEVYNQGDVTGFIRLNGLRLKIQLLQSK